MKKILQIGLLLGLLSLAACQPSGDTIAPAVSLSLSNPTPIAGTALTLSAVASDNIGIKQVEFFANETSLSVDTEAPYELLLTAAQVSAAITSFKAVASDAAGNTSQAVAEVSITSDDTTPPLISLSVSPSVLIAGTAATLSALTDDDTFVSQVEFFDGTTSLGTDITEPFEQALTAEQVTEGSKAFRAVATDTGNNTAEAVLEVTVKPAGTVPVIMTLTSSNPNPVVGKDFKLTAEIDNNDEVEFVKFFRNDASLSFSFDNDGEPYDTKVRGNDLVEGEVTFTAKAFKEGVQVGSVPVPDILIAEASLTLTIAPAPPNPNVSFTVKVKDIKILAKSADETDNALEINGVLSAQFVNDTNTVLDDTTFIDIARDAAPLTLSDTTTFSAISKQLDGTNLAGNKIRININLFERDRFVDRSSFGAKEIGVPVSDLLNTTAAAPFVNDTTLETAEGDSIKISFEIFKN